MVEIVGLCRGIIYFTRYYIKAFLIAAKPLPKPWEEGELEIWTLKKPSFEDLVVEESTPASSAIATVLAYVPQIVMKWNIPQFWNFRKTLHFENSPKIVDAW